jgi:hypothetical protein
MAQRIRRFMPPVIGGLVLLVALLGLIGTAIRDPHPHDLPVGLVGPPQATQQISSAFASNAPGVFRFTSYASEAEARAAIDSRDIDAALLIGQAGPRLIVAGAAGDAVTSVITAAFTNVFKSQGATLDVEVVHPFFPGDAHGLVLFFVVVAVIISSLAVQALLFVAGETGFATRLAVALAFGVLAGPTAMGTADWIAGDYGTGLWSAIGLVMLASAAVGAVVAGLVRLVGRAGFGLAALVVVLLDLVSSGGPAGSEFLPDFYRWLAPWMPAGPLYSGLRGALYFDGAAVAGPILVLSGWLAGGLVLMLLGELVFAQRRRGAAELQPAH